MMVGFDLRETTEKVILVGIQLDGAEDAKCSLDELEELARTAKAEVKGRLIQSREAVASGNLYWQGESWRN